MKTNTNLSEAQLKLLGELPRRVIKGYKPIEALVIKGLAEQIPSPSAWGNPFYERTELGNAELNRRIKEMKK